ncbi:SDR family NAD(P)-dependent oxidoreductase [Deinococcus sp. HMF7604]|uniref:SDR family oxidoreductase n=1 Tax=Deinococcus betulae TaxID=2873312 RepID=UPI001CCD3E1B|nr:SDR family NAD(P)-dependent oxidoreductase [Deinococcus betulae]MBZ9750620.1 SDR family NAD(P)-dependent oxidoreductase [Deinococcus betulae]
MQSNGNTILVTGGSSGIGLALALALQARGNTMLVTGRRQAQLDALTAAHPGLHAYSLDITDPAAIAALAEQVTADHPALNVLINNAGIMVAEDLLTLPDTATAEATVETNLLGPIRLTHALLPHLLRQARPVVVNVTSGLASVPLAATPTYSATKAALHSYTQSLRWQLRHTAAQVIELAPPQVATELMPGGSTRPTAMPLDEFIRETLALLDAQPGATELLVERVLPLRRAGASGTYDAVFQALNSSQG